MIGQDKGRRNSNWHFDGGYNRSAGASGPGVDLSDRGEQAMATDGPALTLLERREIEAKVVGPLIRGFAAEMGHEKALEVVGRVIEGLAREGGAELARGLGDASLEAFAGSLDRWSEGGALEIEVRERSPDRLSFDVVRCKYAEMYRAIGLADLGGSLSCRRDFALVEGFNPEIELTRTRTLMEGASHCDFRFRARGGGPPDGGDAPGRP